MLGLSFKENCSDLRNTRVIDVVSNMRDYGIEVDVHDPWVDPDEARAEYNLTLTKAPEEGVYDGVILAVGHDAFREIGAAGLRRFGKPEHVLYDLKHLFDGVESDLRL